MGVGMNVLHYIWKAYWNGIDEAWSTCGLVSPILCPQNKAPSWASERLRTGLGSRPKEHRDAESRWEVNGTHSSLLSITL